MHPRVFERPWDAPRAWRFIESVFASPALSVLEEAHRRAAVARDVIDEMPVLAGNLVHGAHTAILMREHGIRRIVTRDSDFHRFAGIEPSIRWLTGRLTAGPDGAGLPRIEPLASGRARS